MENIIGKVKILVGDDFELRKEVISLFESVGFNEYRCRPTKISPWVYINAHGNIMNCTIPANSEKEITLSQLKDMATLHRNDPSDANWETEGGDQIYKDLNDKSYIYRSGGWDELQRHEMRQAMWEKYKPIQQKKEYLNTKTGKYFESSTGQPRSLDWIEIPAGATFATTKTNPLFRKDGFYWDDEDPIGGDGVPFWRETSVTLSNAEACGLDVVWVREEPSMNEIIKTAEEYRQSQSEPPALTDFGTGILSVSSETVYHYHIIPHSPMLMPIGGVILFDGRISGVEDYERLRSMIAEAINSKPDDFSISSLTIVG